MKGDVEKEFRLPEAQKVLKHHKMAGAADG
jgi:hypothetical protein